MPEYLFTNVEFDVLEPDQIVFQTQTNGDRIVLTNLQLSPEQAAAMAYLSNKGPVEIEIKLKDV